MEINDIREKLHQFIDTIEDKKAEAIYTLFESEIQADEFDYDDAFKAILDERYEHYKSGGIMISAEDADKQNQSFLQRGEIQ